MTGQSAGRRIQGVIGTMPEKVPVEQAVDAYIRYFEEMSPDTLGKLDRLAVPDIFFKDPFNEFRSRDRLRGIFEHMFKRLKTPRFMVRDHAISNQTAYLRWTFTFRLGGNPKLWSIEGMSEVRFDTAGQATSHIDHWDAAEQFYEKLPVLGGLLRLIKRRMAD